MSRIGQKNGIQGCSWVSKSLPQLAVQGIYLYLQGPQGFTGWDWGIVVQSLVFTSLHIVIRLRKLGKDLRGRREIEMMDLATGAASSVGHVVGV